jgi:hypothetical protein
MKQGKEHFNFEGFMKRLDEALLAAQKTAILAGKVNNDALVRAAHNSIRNIREAREIIDEPLVWFKMEKGTTYKRCEDGVWRAENRRKRRRPQL